MKIVTGAFSAQDPDKGCYLMAMSLLAESCWQVGKGTEAQYALLALLGHDNQTPNSGRFPINERR